MGSSLKAQPSEKNSTTNLSHRKLELDQASGQTQPIYAVSRTATRSETIGKTPLEQGGVPMASRNSGNTCQLIDAPELAARLKLPTTWVRAQSRERIPPDKRIPSVRFGRYRRYDWGSPSLNAWIAKRRV